MSCPRTLRSYCDHRLLWRHFTLCIDVSLESVLLLMLGCKCVECFSIEWRMFVNCAVWTLDLMSMTFHLMSFG